MDQNRDYLFGSYNSRTFAFCNLARGKFLL